jgi:hypothetical protein
MRTYGRTDGHEVSSGFSKLCEQAQTVTVVVKEISGFEQRNC